jgi:hypothetical protein
MKKYIVAATAALTIAVPAIAVPAAQASPTAGQVAQSVQYNWGKAISNRARFTGIKLSQIHVRCGADGGNYYTCYGTYVASGSGQHNKWGWYIDVTPNGQYRSHNGQLIWSR